MVPAPAVLQIRAGGGGAAKTDGSGHTGNLLPPKHAWFGPGQFERTIRRSLPSIQMISFAALTKVLDEPLFCMSHPAKRPDGHDAAPRPISDPIIAVDRH